MSFMFKPYPFTDPVPVNRIDLPQELRQAPVSGNAAVAAELLKKQAKVMLLDGYVSADFSSLIRNIREQLPDTEITVLDMAESYRTSIELEDLLKDTLPEDRVIDPILLFGKSHHFTIDNLIDPKRLKELTGKIEKLRSKSGLVIVCGQGSVQPQLKALADVSLFMDVTPLNAVLRVNARRCGALGDDKERSLRYLWRRLYYFDYEIMMLHRKNLIDENRIDFYIDGNQEENLKMIGLNELKDVFSNQLRSPFRCTPVYIEGVWGGNFVKKLRSLPDDMRNCAWVFDMIPNEVSMQIKIGPVTFNFPFSTFFKAVGKQLMGEESVKRFGYVFPIRFNYDDTYGGNGNMSVQVHPPQKYNQEHFGEPFQQDESYYCVKTAGSKTYQGLQDDCDVEEFFRCIDKAEKEYIPFDYEKYVNSFPSEQGDQFLLPGGTIHASGRNQVILEIGSYTIGSYTFKLYDYLRKDLDGTPRPIHSIHGKNVLVTDRRRSKIDGWLRPKPKTIREGLGWKEEIVGECELIYFSLRRLSFEHSISDCTNGKFHVLTLVEGDEVLVYSKADPSCCFHQKFMDIVVVPASMGEYGIINLGTTPCKVHKALLK